MHLKFQVGWVLGFFEHVVAYAICYTNAYVIRREVEKSPKGLCTVCKQLLSPKTFHVSLKM